MPEVLTSLSREKRGRIIEKFDKGQRTLDEVHATVLNACGTSVRGDAANALLREVDRFADLMAEHRKAVGRLLDELTGDAP